MFDGNGNTISNLMINRSGSNRIGLFGYTNDKAEITNIGLLNVNVIGNDDVGGLVGRNSGTITDSYATGNVEGDSRIGGLVGESENLGTTASITNSYATGNVEGNQNQIGGLVGNNTNIIRYSYATGKVEGASFIGGLAGASNGTIEKNREELCYG